jgi:protein-tyrosine phosphatase
MAAVDWDGVENVRDIGGLPAPGGGCIVPGVVIRSGSLDNLTTLGRRQVLALRPVRIIDLRSTREIAQP